MVLPPLKTMVLLLLADIRHNSTARMSLHQAPLVVSMDRSTDTTKDPKGITAILLKRRLLHSLLTTATTSRVTLRSLHIAAATQ